MYGQAGKWFALIFAPVQICTFNRQSANRAERFPLSLGLLVDRKSREEGWISPDKKSIKKREGEGVNKATNYDRNWFSAREHEAVLSRFARTTRNENCNFNRQKFHLIIIPVVRRTKHDLFPSVSRSFENLF